MIEKRCEKCNKIIVEDWERWLIENENAAYIQCNYCMELEKLEW